jgi:hypothetical protein
MADNVAVTNHFSYRTNILTPDGKSEIGEFCTKCGIAWPCDAAVAQREIATLRAALIDQHRKVLAEWSGNFGGHVAIRDGWVEYDEETTTEDCDICAALATARVATCSAESDQQVSATKEAGG